MDFAKAIARLLPETKPPEERKARTVPPNLGHGDSHFDSLLYYLMRESYRALTRSLVEKELENVTPLAVSSGHTHSENQAGAMEWWQAGVHTPVTSEGPAFSVGPLIVDVTTETDYLFAPFILPAGCARIWHRAKVSTVTLGDVLNLHLRIFSPADLNSATPIEGGRLSASDMGGGTLSQAWMSFDSVDVSSLPTTNGVKLGVALWSANVSAGGQVGHLWQTSFGLRPGA